MEVVFWGTRGSLPYAVTSSIIKEKIKAAVKLSENKELASSEDLKLFVDNDLPFSISGGYGCNTSCVEIRGGNEYVLCDAGTGLRDFGNHHCEMTGKGKANQPQIFNIFLSHLHWDHIQGFPFFTPAYIPGNIINIFGFHDGIEDAFKGQQAQPFFPVGFDDMMGTKNFVQLELGKEYQIGGFTVKGILQNHPGDSYGYSFEKNNNKVVYSTDSEHKTGQPDSGFIDFCHGADLLITDAQYSLIDTMHTKKNWGHSSNIAVTELAVQSKVKQLCLFHHEPTCDDKDLDRFLTETRNYLEIFDSGSNLEVDMAYDGMKVIISEKEVQKEARMEGLDIELKQQGGILIYKLSGRLDGKTSDDLEQTIFSRIDSDIKGIILDMKLLEYVSSAGLRVILILKKESNAKNITFSICELQKTVKQVFQIAGFSSFIDIDLSCEQSIEIAKN